MQASSAGRRELWQQLTDNYFSTKPIWVFQTIVRHNLLLLMFNLTLFIFTDTLSETFQITVA